MGALAGALFGAALLVVSLSSSQGQEGSPKLSAKPLLHVYVPPPSEREAAAWAKRGELPDQIRVGRRSGARERLLPRPALSTAKAPGERPLGATQRMDRSTAMSPDRTTTHDSRLRYTASFNPSVVPFKRLHAYDAVGGDLKLRVADARLRPLPLRRSATPPDREAFWGSVLLDLAAGKPAPLPSVAPEAAILSYRAEPKQTLRFFRDSAGNQWVSGERPGRLRLVFLTDARRRYFSPEVPADVSVEMVPRALRPRLPAAAREAARKVIAHIGVRSQLLHRQLQRLVAYFRNFRPGRLEGDRGSTYLDIALSQRGVCRHRAYAFVITAQALGIPARYVANEAHAFVEVFAPRQGWLRVDLGGASTGFSVRNAERKAVHRPGPDPFPRPSAYTNNYSQLRGSVRGLRRGQFLRRRGPASRRGLRRSLSRFRGARGGEGTATPGLGSGGQRVDPRLPPRPRRTPGEGASGEGASGDSARPLAPLATARPRRATRTTLYSSTSSVFRGRRLQAWGQVQAGPAGVAGLRVEIYLSKDGQEAILLGATVTNALGAYKARVPVPQGIDVGRYQIFAATPGDADHGPSLSR